MPRIATSFRALAGALLIAQVAGPCAAQAAHPFHKPLEALALELARGGARHEALEVWDVLERLGADPAGLAKLRVALLDAASARKPGKVDHGKLAQAVTRCARGLGPGLAKLDDAARTRAAGELLLLADIDEAHVALGHVGRDGRFVDEIEEERQKRRAEIRTALARARKLEIPLTVEASTHPLLQAVYGRPGTLVRWERLMLHTPWSAEKATRIAREALRADALANWLLTGQLQPKGMGFRIVHCDKREDYETAVAKLRAEGAIDARDEEHALKLAGVHCRNGEYVGHGLVEMDLAASMLARNRLYDTTPAVAAGLLQWVCMAQLGTSLPNYMARADPAPGVREGGPTRASDPEAIERETMRRLAKAGVMGCRSWIAWLARRREDPAWLKPPRDDFAKITGDDLMKCALVAEYLHERGVLGAVATATRSAKADTPAFAPAFEQVLGESIADFETGWRRWLLRGEGDLATRLGGRAAQELTPLERATLAHLEKLRAGALAGSTNTAEKVRLGIERSRAAACALHAEYLQKNPAQVTAWPDAHEEYPDREGFTAEGAWAGLHSVIAPGVGSMTEAIDAWMGTFYHRLPLLEPGLLRIGFGMSGTIAVLDAGSLCIPLDGMQGHAIWPPAGGKGIPTRFSPELPNPVPGEDQSRFGYPVTLQVGQLAVGRSDDVQMQLHLGNERGPLVDSWYSTPAQPTNKDCVPRHSFCLIPKAELKGNSLYTVVAEVPGIGRLVWSFRT